MSAKKTILYVQTSGVDTSERTYAPFIPAATATAMGLEATIYFVLRALPSSRKAQMPYCASRRV